MLDKTPPYRNNFATGLFYFSEGLRLLKQPELRLYILVPLALNSLLFLALTSVFLHYFGELVDSTTESLPGLLAPLAWIAWILAGMLGLVVYGYSFNIITNIIASPFYGALAARTEALLTGQEPPDESIGQMIVRTFGRELSKLLYFLGRGILVVLIMFLVGTLPLIQIISPFIGLAWGAWSMSIQYADYASDNNQLGFRQLRNCLWEKKYSSLGFGGIVMICSVIPILNIFAMPAAVTGGTLFWLHELRGCQNGCPVKANKPEK